MQYFVYKWTNATNGKMYVGSHRGSIDDGYTGSGIHFMRAYLQSPATFSREVLEFCDDEISLRLREEEILSQLNAAADPNYYNLTNTAGGGDKHSHLSDERRKSIYKAWKVGSMLRLQSMSSEEKEELKMKKRCAWAIRMEDSEFRQRLSDSHKKRCADETHEEKLIRSMNIRKSYWRKSEDERREHQNKRSVSIQKSYTPELKQQRRENFLKANTGTRYMTDGSTTKRVKPEMVDSFLTSGWSFGMAPKTSIHHDSSDIA